MAGIDRAPEGFDVIGDVHGAHDELLALLAKLGYVDDSGVHRHPTRRAVFVGDLIDRNPKQLEVLRTVRAMEAKEAALVVMGNHELNAIAFATPDPRDPSKYRRAHSEKNLNQHQAFLDAVPFGSADHAELIAWFRTLPLWLDLGGLRVVHACWDSTAIAAVRARGGPKVDDELLVASSEEGTPEHGWLEHLCKGPEVPLPGGLFFFDKGGHKRHHARFRWWDPAATSYANGCEVPPRGDLPPIPHDPIEEPPVSAYVDEVPVIFGHYWRSWPEKSLLTTAGCVDYSAGKGGPLVAYRWSGEEELVEDHLVASRS